MPDSHATLLDAVGRELMEAAVNAPLTSHGGWEKLGAVERSYWLDRALMILAMVARRRWYGREELEGEQRPA